MKDILLIKQLKDGHVEAYGVLYRKYYKVLVVYANQYLKDLQAAEDVTQDTFVHIYEIRESLEIKTSFKAYMYTAIRHSSLNYLTKHKKMVDAPAAYIDGCTEDDDTQIITNVELAEKIHIAISRLPEQNQKIFKLSRYRGLNNEEIAQKTGLTKRTVETHISNALKKIKKILLSILLFMLHLETLVYVFCILILSY